MKVLSTLEEDGRRRWLAPRLARGRFLRHRRIVGYALIALFVALPFVRIGGRPAVLLDLAARELSLFGAVFRPSDGFLLMFAGLAIVLAIVLVTALFGRVWCGWGCPQTVYLEHVFRPIERWLEGSPARRRKLAAAGALGPRRALKWALYVALSVALANVFLAYFVGVDRLAAWMFGSPFDHPVGFVTVVATSALMLLDFAWFREQTCIIACPYGRLQAVLLDRQSLIVGYDARRGEPRGQPRKRLPVLASASAAEARGDCVDCGACVAVCPTGIDIRDGLQMECIGCAQCIDACDAVMDRVGAPRGLIGYTSQGQLAGEPRRLLRARTIAYPALLAVVGALLAWSLGSRPATKIWVDRVEGAPFVELPEGRVASQVRLKLDNESGERRTYAITLHDAPDAQLRAGQLTWEVRARRAAEIPLFVDVARASFVRGKREVRLRVADDRGFARLVEVTLLGPEGAAPAPAPGGEP